MNAEKLWSMVLNDVKETISRSRFETWFVNTDVEYMTESELIIKTANMFQRDWLEGRYQSMVDEALNQLTDEKMTVRFISEMPPAEDKKSFSTERTSRVELVQKVSDLEAKVENLEDEIERLKAEKES